MSQRSGPGSTELGGGAGTLVAHAASDVGRVRGSNEDRFLCGTTVFAVADGMGGHAGGEVAAALVIEALVALDDERFHDADDALQALVRTVRAANGAVWEASHREGPPGMGTTVTAAVVHSGSFAIAHVGDSRAYLLHGDRLTQLTADHTPPGELLAAGGIDAEAAETHPERHLLTRAIGTGPDVDVDTRPPRPLSSGDRLLLCSDGLSGVVNAETIARALRHPPAEACQELLHAALDAGGPDNVTVVVLAAA